jgi:hypothetical protein
MEWNKVLKHGDKLILFTIPDNNKKYRATIFNKDLEKIKTVYFGSKKYQQYKDILGFYKNLDHGDKNRRMNYRKRHSKVLNKEGKPAYTIPFTPAWFSWNILW